MYGAPDAKVALLLIKHGADAAHADGGGQTALHIAASNGHARISKLLGALNTHAKSGKTALHVAADEGKPDAAAALLGLGADATLRDAKGKTAQELGPPRRRRRRCAGSPTSSSPPRSRAERLVATVRVAHGSVSQMPNALGSEDGCCCISSHDGISLRTTMTVIHGECCDRW